MAILRKNIGTNPQVIVKEFRSQYSDGLGGLAFQAFCDGWHSAWRQMQHEKLVDTPATPPVRPALARTACKG